MATIDLILGGILLLLGRKFFWLSVGILCFIAGLNLATRLLAGRPQWIVLVVAILAGFIGAGLAIFLQRLAIAVAGFLAGGYILINLVGLLGSTPTGALYWVLLIVGGIFGAILVTAFFDWALIVLSSLTGANLIVEAMRLAPPGRAFWLILLIVVGVVIQAILMLRDQRAAPAA
ncbi:MAG TPA: hypothetical protein VMT46_09580 [Anaerolineaceae bacterium]|nr:hypothetical protein [Anaerolineaceae bacterium]